MRFVKTEIRVSVRELVEYSERTGDLNLTLFGGENPVRAIRIHQAIQKSRPAEYAPEMQVLYETELEGYLIKIGGRIDGVYEYHGHAVIDEIKTTKKSLPAVQEEENKMHWGQAKCYGYIYAVQHSLTKIAIQLTYYNIDEKDKLEIRREFDVKELESFFDELIRKYIAWADTTSKWVKKRNETLGETEFPFKRYRAGQEKMIQKVASALEDREDILIQAPTGTGKTMAVMLPAIKKMVKDKDLRVFYLTARTTGRKAAEKCLDILRGNGLSIKHISLTAKDKICFNPDKACNGAECSYAKGFYYRINEAVRDAFQRDRFSMDAIQEYAEKHRLCPFEFSLELALWVDVIICDYNYVFDPRVYLRRFFDMYEGRNMLLVDEAHNLVDRSREMFSASLQKSTVLALRRRLKNALPNIYRRLGSINSFFLKERRAIPEDSPSITRDSYPDELCGLLRKFLQETEQWLARNQQADFREDLTEFYFDARRFVNTAENYDSGYATYYLLENAEFLIRLFCIDPGRHIQDVLKKCHATVFFSATLEPMDYFARLFGCSYDIRRLTLPSPFISENLKIMVAGGISVMYRHRNATRHMVGEMINSLVSARKGNYLVFFPSYAYMKMVCGVFKSPDEETDILVQNPGMSEAERDSFLASFKDNNSRYLIGFAVMGGFFAESIDLVGNKLTGAVIVGVGFPKINTERELIKGYFNKLDHSGLAFAYQIPGMIKVLQAAGRVIRSETDRGAVLLIDSRYPEEPYRNMMPYDWKPQFVRDAEDIGSALGRFWDGGN